jgi:hypothetical protein
VKLRWFECKKRSTSSNSCSTLAFSLELLALDAKSNYACFGEGLRFISDSKDSVGVFL